MLWKSEEPSGFNTNGKGMGMDDAFTEWPYVKGGRAGEWTHLADSN